MRKREREAWKILKPLGISTQRNRRGGHYRLIRDGKVIGSMASTPRNPSAIRHHIAMTLRDVKPRQGD
jgi:hypothetical protein